MKNIKRAVLCILCMFVAAMSFASCGAEKTKPAQSSAVNEDNTEKIAKARKTAESFMNALCKMDASTMADLCVDGQALKMHFPYEDFKTYVVGTNLAGIPSDNEQKKLCYYEPVVSYYADKVTETNSYTIKKTTETDNGYEVLLTIETYNALDVTSKVGAAIKEDILEKRGSEISRKLLENGTVTEASTEEEMISALYKGAVDEVLPLIDSALESSKKISGDYVVYTVEKNGKMLVDVTRSTAVFALSASIAKIY